MITRREEAVELAALKIEEDSAPYIRRVEAAISLWDGSSPLRISFSKETPERMMEYLEEQYQNAGWDASYGGVGNQYTSPYLTLT